MKQHDLVSVCLCTCDRREWLGELLDALAGEVDSHTALEVIVVDNDVRESARSLVAAESQPKHRSGRR